MTAQRLFAVIGDPIGHSHSPLIHNTLFRQLGEDAQYIALRVRPQGVSAAQSLLRDNALGWNVTIPHKAAVMADLDTVDTTARQYGVVNTVKNVGGQLQGYNTDGYGFLAGLGQWQQELPGQKVLVLGAGGSSRVVVQELLQAGSHVVLANRNRQRALDLAAQLPEHLQGGLQCCQLDEVQAQERLLVVNTTPVGMSPHVDEAPLTKEQLRGTAVVYDLIYNPWRTRLLDHAAALGAVALNGWPMLFYQAMKSQEIWREEALPAAVVADVYQEVTAFVERQG